MMMKEKILPKNSKKLIQNTKCQDNNPDLVLLFLKLIHDGLEKKPYLVDEVYDTTFPDVVNLLKLYKDNPDIEEAGYSSLFQIAKNKVYAASMINNGVLPLIKEILENVIFSDSLKEKYKPIKSELLKLLRNISKDEGNSPKIADEIIGQLIQDLNDKGYTEESNGKEILQLLNTLLSGGQCVAPFTQCGGIDAVINLLNKNESNVELAMRVFKILKKLSNSSDE